MRKSISQMYHLYEIYLSTISVVTTAFEEHSSAIGSPKPFTSALELQGLTISYLPTISPSGKFSIYPYLSLESFRFPEYSSFGPSIQVTHFCPWGDRSFSIRWFTLLSLFRDMVDLFAPL